VSADARDPGIRTVLFTDIVDSTLLTQYLGDEIAMEFLRIHDMIVRDALAACNGREVKHTGDGIMASFISSAAAVRCAARIQRDLAERREERIGHPLKVRIGGAAGDVQINVSGLKAGAVAHLQVNGSYQDAAGNNYQFSSVRGVKLP
jgi:class 3 adenylate cyclase